MIDIRKSMLTMGSILVLFVLVSISYQPLVADESIETINQIKELDQSTNKITKLNDLLIRTVKSSIQSNNDCDCNNKDDPLICYLLLLIFWGIFSVLAGIEIIIHEITPKISEILGDLFYNLFVILVTPIGLLYQALDCPPVGYPPYK